LSGSHFQPGFDAFSSPPTFNMENVFEITFSRSRGECLGFEVYCNKDANLVIVAETDLAGPVPVVKGDLVRCANGEALAEDILFQITTGTSDLRLQIERYNIAGAVACASPPKGLTLPVDMALDAALILTSENTSMTISDWKVRESPYYLGVYFTIWTFPIRRMVHAHITLAHWHHPVVELQDAHKSRILKKAQDGKHGIFARRLALCDGPVTDLGHRALVTFHVAGHQHQEMSGLSQMATAFLRTLKARPASRWRVNYHLSVDGPASLV